jgi:hypothetical protein
MWRRCWCLCVYVVLSEWIAAGTLVTVVAAAKDRKETAGAGNSYPP